MNPDNRYRPPYPSKSPTPTRETDISGSSRQQIYIDDETLHRMIESFGPLDYPQFAATIAGQEVFEQDAFGPMGWQPELPWGPQGAESTRRKSRSPRADTSASTSDQKYLMGQSLTELEAGNPQVAKAAQESIMEWFDREVNKELSKRRDSQTPTASPVDPALAQIKAKHSLNLSKGTAERMAETSASRIEITARLETDFTTELTDAVEKLAKAENMSNYTEALQAAEEAALNAPPELMEQAAAAEARRIQTELTKVKDTIPGIRPIEVLGYVGITKPVHPKKPI